MAQPSPIVGGFFSAVPPLAPRLDLALEFWRNLTGHEDSPITLQFFDDIEARRTARKKTKEKDPYAYFRHGSLRQLWATVEQLQSFGSGVFYTLNETDGRGRSAKNIVRVRVAGCDHDDVSFDPARVNGSAPPSILVTSSPGHAQSLWKLAENESREEWGPLLENHMIPHFGSDPPCHDLPRVFRLPGTLHQKRAPHLVTAQYFDVGRRFTVDELRAAYPRKIPARPTPIAPAPLSAVQQNGASITGGHFPPAYDPSGALLDPLTAEIVTPDPDAATLFGPKRAAGLTLLAKYWPESGRHSAQLALAGGLLQDLADDGLACDALAAVCRIAGDEDRTKRETTISYTRAAIDEGRSITSWHSLPIDPRVVQRAYEWFSETDTLAAAIAATQPNVTPSPGGAVELGATEPGNWMAAVIYNNKNFPTGCVSNAVLMFDNHPTWSGVLSYNMRAMKVVLERQPWPNELDPGKPYPRFVEDYDATMAATWMGVAQKMEASSGTVMEAMLAVAQKHAFDPVVDYLDALDPWDKVPRLDKWLHDYVGAGRDGDLRTSIYVSIVGKRWMIQNVARAYRPGCQADIVPIFEGAQGILKSSMLRVLFVDPEFFSDQLPPIDNKDAKAHVHGPWGVEVPELAAMGKAKIEAQKAFLTMREDKFRPPYGRVEISVLRGCSFAGTLNPGENGYLKDHTGNRRFLPITCTKIDIVGLEKARDQLWAEAKFILENPDRREVSWITKEEVDTYVLHQQDARMEYDALEERISKSLTAGVRKDPLELPFGGAGVGVDSWAIAPGAKDVSVAEIMAAVCDDKGELSQGLQTRVGRALQRLGWERYQAGPRVWRYRRA